MANVEAEKERAAIADASAFEATGKAARLQADLALREAPLEHERLARKAVQAKLDESRVKLEDVRARLDRALVETAQVRESAQQSIAEAINRFGAAERRAPLEIN